MACSVRARREVARTVLRFPDQFIIGYAIPSGKPAVSSILNDVMKHGSRGTEVPEGAYDEDSSYRFFGPT